jgi:hypothetical protein
MLRKLCKFKASRDCSEVTQQVIMAILMKSIERLNEVEIICASSNAVNLTWTTLSLYITFEQP